MDIAKHGEVDHKTPNFLKASCFVLPSILVIAGTIAFNQEEVSEADLPKYRGLYNIPEDIEKTIGAKLETLLESRPPSLGSLNPASTRYNFEVEGEKNTAINVKATFVGDFNNCAEFNVDLYETPSEMLKPDILGVTWVCPSP